LINITKISDSRLAGGNKALLRFAHCTEGHVGDGRAEKVVGRYQGTTKP